MDNEICGICYDPSNFSVQDCDHKFCNDCIFTYVKGKIEDEESNMYCPYDSCGITISDEQIKDIIDNDYNLLEKYSRISNLSDLDRTKVYSMCPNCKNICKKKDNTNKIYCSDCDNCYCYICNEEHRSYYYDNCPNESDINSTLQEIMNALGDEDVKLCPICKIVIYREEGCSSIRCKYCKTKFCWYCLQTNQTIKKSDKHNCEKYNGFHRTDSDDEYIDGYD